MALPPSAEGSRTEGASPSALEGPPGIDVVFFDIGSTLMYNCPTVPEMFCIVANERGHALLLADVKAHMPAIDAFYEQELERNGDFWCSHEGAVGMWQQMYRLLAGLCGLADDASGISEEIHRRYRDPSSWAVYDDVIACLRILVQQGYRLGVISNWDADLETILEGVGLRGFFDDVVASAVVGYRKPDPRIFETACARMGVAPRSAVHVGDLPDADGAAARVGIMPVIVDRAGVHKDCDCARIDSLAALPALLEHLRS